MEPPVPPHPAPYRLVLVGGAVVQDELDLQPGRYFAVDGGEQGEKLLVSVPAQAPAVQPAASCSLVIVAPGPGRA